jgi:hypothetical protein
MEEHPKHKEIKDLDFSKLDTKQIEMLKKIINLLACMTVDEFEGITGDKEKITIGCMCGQCQERLNINQLISRVKELDSRGIEEILNYVQILFLMSELNKRPNTNSWRYKLKKWWQIKIGI